MGTKVADVMTQRPRAVTPQTPLNEVAEVMETEDVGAVPCRRRSACGDRHRSRHRGTCHRQGQRPARDAGVRGLLARASHCESDDDLSDALKLMAQYQVRRLAVTAEDDRLVGVVSQADVALQGKGKDTGEVVEGISRQPKARAHPDHALECVSEAPEGASLALLGADTEPRCMNRPASWRGPRKRGRRNAALYV
jgi:Predicted transcriptional regulator, contains C-terminal CBS domains